MATVLVPVHGEGTFTAGEKAKLLIAENEDRVGGVIQNNSGLEFRLIAGEGPPPTPTHGMVLRPGRHIQIANFIGYQPSGQQPLFKGNIFAVCVAGGTGQLDFLEVLAVTGME